MNRKCTICNGQEFAAQQHCMGNVAVAVTVVAGGRACVIRNLTDDGRLDASELAFGSPTGPFKCLQCGALLGAAGQPSTPAENART